MISTVIKSSYEEGTLKDKQLNNFNSIRRKDLMMYS